MGLFDLLRAAVQPAAAARAGYLQGQDQEQDKQRKTLLETVKNAREQALTNAQIAHLNAQAHSLDEGQWGPAFNAADETGTPILVQQHKQTGALRRAMITDGATDASSATSPALPSIAEPKPANLALPPDSQDMTGADAGSSPVSPMQQGTSAQPGQPTPKKTALSPYVKPATSTRPASMIPGTPEWLAAQEAAAQIHAKYRPAAHDQTQVIQGVDPVTHQPTYAAYDKNTGKLTVIPFGLKPGGAGGSSGSAQVQQARLLGAVSEGRLADQRMTDFEAKHLKGGKMDIGTAKQVGGQLATGLAGSHSLTDIIAGSTAEGVMNRADPDYLQYMRDARLISRAEQLMSSRGGSEAQASDNAFLARGGANAPEKTVHAAQNSRRALFGKLGAVVQTLTPDQLDKLNKGLAALAGDDPNFDYSGLGKELGLDQATAAPSPGGGRGGSPSTGPTNRGGKYGKLPPGPTGPPTPNGVDLNTYGSKPTPAPAGAFGDLVPKKPDEELE